MADIRCPNCGKSNPDLLDVCQFCQTPLKPDSVLRFGEKPTKKNTGELEPILPDWLRDVRQQARNAAEEEAAQAESQPKPQKNEPPDLLAGLASQSESAEQDDVPDWLASLNPTAKSTPPAPSASTPADASDTDFFDQFNPSGSKPEPVVEPPQDTTEDAPSWMSGLRDQTSTPADKDELSQWFTQASEGPEERVESDAEPGDAGWESGFDLPSASAPTPPAKEEEDLSWLHNLEAASKQTGDLESPKQGRDWKTDSELPSTPSQPPASQQDLSWLDRLGGIEEPAQPTSEQPAAPQPQGDLSWLDQFGGTSAPPQPSIPATPPSQGDLDWLNNLGAPSESQPVDAAPNQPIPTQPFVSDEDLDWLNKLGEGSEPVQPVQPSVEDKQAAGDLSWLNELGGKPEELSVPPFAEVESGTEKVPPRQTAPLNKEAPKESEPDWLKSATEAPSMPAPGDLSMDWFSGSGQTTREKTPPAAPQAVPFESDTFSTASEPASVSNEEVDSLFSVEMPDWLSRPDPETPAPVSQQTGPLPTESDESLSPADLPSWVQAMRPVEAVISETASSVADQPAETDGPLAGLHGVIPMAPIGSSRRPKPISLTLQAPPEQQASAVLLEQILGSETSPRALITSSVVTSQQWLRWALSGLFLLVLSSVILLRSQIMPIPADPASLPEELRSLSNAVVGIPANAKVLVVVDYEPSLAGEMEAISGPLLDQIALLSQPNLAFVATSPNGLALAERLMVNVRIKQADLQYQNLGYLPGGSAGVRGFIEAPGQIIPFAGVQNFSEYSALVVLTDHVESGRVWVEQLQTQADPGFRNQPLLVVASAQAGPLLQPYVSSRQITGMISGLADATRYDESNGRRGIARSYWDTFGVGLMMAISLIIVGSLWSLFTGIRARRASAEQG